VGGQASLIRRAEAEVARLSESVKGSATAARESLRSISALSERLHPSCAIRAVMVQALATTHPIALLAGRRADALRRRDDETDDPDLPGYVARLHARRGPKTNEVDEGKRYWTPRFADFRQMPRRRGRRSLASSDRRARPTSFA
jgi:hypothetical protein